MRCPACESLLQEHSFEDLEVDICSSGCGGIWFDRFELQRVDESHEILGRLLLETANSEAQVTPSASAQSDRRYDCPRCRMIMMRHLFKPGIQVEVDTCPKCAGVWLDHDELSFIRGSEGSDAQRQLAAARYIENMFEQLRKSDK